LGADALAPRALNEVIVFCVAALPFGLGWVQA
jgi:hypothetical protein